MYNFFREAQKKAGIIVAQTLRDVFRETHATYTKRQPRITDNICQNTNFYYQIYESELWESRLILSNYSIY